MTILIEYRVCINHQYFQNSKMYMKEFYSFCDGFELKYEQLFCLCVFMLIICK